MAGGSLPAIADLNGLGRGDFIAALHPLFEGGGPLLARLWEARPFSGYEDLLDRAERLSSSLTGSEQVDLVNSHPRLGEPAEALKHSSTQSYEEQGLAATEPEAERAAREELRRLSYEYEKRHRFRFVVFVNRRPPSALLEILKRRMEQKSELELATALDSYFAIARDRLARLQEGP